MPDQELLPVGNVEAYAEETEVMHSCVIKSELKVMDCHADGPS